MSGLNELIYHAIMVAHWRDGDVDTEDGTYATTDTDEMIRMESSIQGAFDGMEANDLVCTGRVGEYIQNAINQNLTGQISASTRNNHLRIKELEELVSEFRDFAVRQGWEHVLINKADKLLANK